jgi:hypothetical protein
VEHDRRRYPRVEVFAAVLGGPLSLEPAAHRAPAITGRLVNAGQGGIAFVCDEPLRDGDLIELVVSADEGGTLLQKHVRVLGCVEDALHRRIVRCAFVEPLHDLAWLERLVAQQGSS